VRLYIQPYMKSTPRVCTCVLKRSPYDQYEYESYMVKYGQARPSTENTVSISISLFLISNSIVVSPVVSAIAIYNYKKCFFVERLKIYEAKLSK